jgi:hypothetical protein
MPSGGLRREANVYFVSNESCIMISLGEPALGQKVDSSKRQTRLMGWCYVSSLDRVSSTLLELIYGLPLISGVSSTGLDRKKTLEFVFWISSLIPTDFDC